MFNGVAAKPVPTFGYTFQTPVFPQLRASTRSGAPSPVTSSTSKSVR